MGGGAHGGPKARHFEPFTQRVARVSRIMLRMMRGPQNWVEPEWGRYQLDPSDHVSRLQT